MIQSGGKIERADYFDMPRLVNLARDYHAEIFPGYPFEEELLAQNLEQFLDNPSIKMWVYRDGKEVVGVIAFVIAKPVSGGPLTATELFWYIDKDHRGSTSGVRLLKYAEDWLRKNDVEVIQMAAMETSMPDKIEAALGRMGYQPAERHFRKLLNEDAFQLALYGG